MAPTQQRVVWHRLGVAVRALAHCVAWVLGRLPALAATAIVASGLALWWWAGTPGSLPQALALAQPLLRPWVPALSGLTLDAPQATLRHGGGHPGGNWYEVSETFAVSWGQQRYSCRHLKVKNPGR